MAAITQRTNFQKINPYLPSSKALNVLRVVGLMTSGYFGFEYAKGRAFSALAIGQSALGALLANGSLYWIKNYLTYHRIELAKRADLNGHLAFNGKEYGRAIPLLMDALIAWKQLGSENLDYIAASENKLGICFRQTNNYQLAIQHYTEALKIGREQSDDESTARVLHNLGVAYICAGKPKEALPFLNEALEKRKKIYLQGDHAEIAMTHEELGYAHKGAGNAQDAKTQFGLAQEMYTRLRDRQAAAQFQRELDTL